MSNELQPAFTELVVTQDDLARYNSGKPAYLKAELWELDKVEVILNSYPMASREPKVIVRDRNYMKKYSGNPNYSGPMSQEDWQAVFRESALRRNAASKEQD